MKFETVLKFLKFSDSQWTPESLKTYVEAVKIARTLGSRCLIGFAVLQLISVLIIGLWQGLSVIQPWNPETWAWIQISICGSLLLLILMAGLYILSEPFWIRIFKINQALNSVNRLNEESDEPSYQQQST